MRSKKNERRTGERCRKEEVRGRKVYEKEIAGEDERGSVYIRDGQTER